MHQPGSNDRTRFDSQPTEEKRSREHDRQNAPHLRGDEQKTKVRQKKNQSL
jgi:hypothetical protein